MGDTPHQAEVLAEHPGAEYHTEAADVGAGTFEEARCFNRRVAGLVAAAVVGDGRELLFIHHESYGGWVLPGGVAEIGEDLRGAAVREVYEETGVRATIDEPLLVVEFVNRHDGRSTSCHFVLFEGEADDGRTADDPGLADEPITEVRWMDSIPDDTPDDGTVQYTLDVVRERFGWLD